MSALKTVISYSLRSLDLKLCLLVISIFIFTAIPVFAQDTTTPATDNPPADNQPAADQPATDQATPDQTTTDQTPAATGQTNTNDQSQTGQSATEPSPSPFSLELINNGQGEAADTKNWNFLHQGEAGIYAMIHSGFCNFDGFSPMDKCSGIKNGANGQPAVYLYDKLPGGGAIGGISTLIASTYTPPTSSARYLANLFEDMGIAPKNTYAAGLSSCIIGPVTGSGCGVILPVEALWQVTRNIAYVVFIIVFITIGFMIMFGRRIDSHTVVSAQQALPGVVIGIILVTFSYFIAALIIDISFWGVQLVAQIFIQSGMKVDNLGTNTIQGAANNSNVFQLFLSSARFGGNFGDITGGLYRTIFSTTGGGAADLLLPMVIGSFVGALMGGLPGALIGGTAAATAPAIIGLLLSLILIIALLIQFFRLFWQLISAYISLLIATVAGPLVIVFASIPGRGGVLSWWWRSLLGNSLVFPAVFAAFLFAGMILGLPTEQFNAQPPLFGGLSTELLRLILAYGIILGTPAIPPMVKNMMGVKGPEGITQVAFGGVASARGLVEGGYKRATHPLTAAKEAEERSKIYGPDEGIQGYILHNKFLKHIVPRRG